MSDDEPRFLLRAGGRGDYADWPADPLRAGEALSEADQRAVTRQAADKELQTWTTSRRRIEAEVEHLRSHCRLAGVDRACRALQRELTALDRRLT